MNGPTLVGAFMVPSWQICPACQGAGGRCELTTTHYGYQGQLSGPNLSSHTVTTQTLWTPCTLCNSRGGTFYRGVP